MNLKHYTLILFMLAGSGYASGQNRSESVSQPVQIKFDRKQKSVDKSPDDNSISQNDCMSPIASGTTGTLKWTVCEDGTLTVSGSGAMKDYSKGTAPWYGNSIKTIVLTAGITSIGNYAFINCTDLTRVAIPNTVTSIGSSAFYGCSRLTSVTIPNSVTVIETYAFESCSGLASVTIPNSVTEIKQAAFYGCSGLTSLAIPNSLTVVETYVFYGCSGLTSVAIPGSVVTVGYGAFKNCSGLTSVTIPGSVTSIGGGAFASCSRLTEIINHRATPQTLDIGNFGDTFARVNQTSCTLRVPAASVSAYRAAEYWNVFTNIVALP